MKHTIELTDDQEIMWNAAVNNAAPHHVMRELLYQMKESSVANAQAEAEESEETEETSKKKAPAKKK